MENEVILLRKADKSDLELTFNWAQNELVRKYSLNSNPISFREHENWFLDRILRSDCFYFIAEWNNRQIGSFRLDIKDSGKAIISYLLDPAFHGLGLGTELLKNGINLAQKNGILVLVGYVKKENRASITIFEKLQFQKFYGRGDLIRFEKSLE